MTLARKSAASVLVFAAGISAAFMFRAPKGERNSARPASGAREPVSLRAPPGPHILSEVSPRRAGVFRDIGPAPDEDQDGPATGEATSALGSPLDLPDAPPPSLGARYAGRSARAGKRTGATEGAPLTDGAAPSEGGSIQDNGTAPADDDTATGAVRDDEESTVILHTVRDGDTLARLAQRYLGSAARAGEILSANRAVLASPDPLPIGVELKIPR